MRQIPIYENPNHNQENHDAIEKARKLRQLSKIPRVRTMKKILKKVVQMNRKNLKPDA